MLIHLESGTCASGSLAICTALLWLFALSFSINCSFETFLQTPSCSGSTPGESLVKFTCFTAYITVNAMALVCTGAVEGCELERRPTNQVEIESRAAPDPTALIRILPRGFPVGVALQGRSTGLGGSGYRSATLLRRFAGMSQPALLAMFIVHDTQTTMATLQTTIRRSIRTRWHLV